MNERPPPSVDGRSKGGPSLVADLAAGRPTADLAAETGLSERTIRRRRRDPEVLEARAVLADRMIDQLAGSATRAVATLDRLLDCPNPSVSVSAARTILQGLVAMREHDELVARIEALEDARSAAPGGRRP
jgi:hypothetical protein